MRLLALCILLLSLGCGINGEQKFTANSSTQTITLNFGFLTQIENLCRAQLLEEDYTNTILYNQAVATCVFSNLTLLNPAQLQALQQNCQPEADLSSYTEEQVLNIQNTCALMGF